MDPVTMAALAYGGGKLAGSLFADPQAADYSGAQNTLTSGIDKTMAGLRKDADTAQGMLTTDRILNDSARLRQDANAYENSMTVDGVLRAYGGDVLGGQTRAHVTNQLAQLNRGNYQTALQNALGLTGQRVGVQNQLMEGNSQLGTARAQGIASIQAKQAEADAAAANGQGLFSGLF